MSPSDPVPRRVRLFRNNRNQALRIPVEFELPGTEALLTRQSDRLIIQPVPELGLVALLDGWSPLAESFPEIDDPPPPPDPVF